MNPVSLSELKASDISRYTDDFEPYFTCITQQAHTLHTSLFLVGGCVRDMFLQKPVYDLDFTVLHPVHDFVNALAAQHQGTVQHNEAFKTARWITPTGCTFDFANPRKEFYPHPASLPHVTAHPTHLDMERRDFTINAMALSIEPNHTYTFYDPHHGLLDLQHRTLRVLHNESFRDDPTRMFRAARFCARFGMQLHQDTHERLQESLHHGHASALSMQRIGHEWQLIWKEPTRAQAYTLLHSWDVLQHIPWPDFGHAAFLTDLQHIPHNEKNAASLCWLSYAKHIPHACRETYIPYIHQETQVSASLFCNAPEEADSLASKLQHTTCQEDAGVLLNNAHPLLHACVQLWHVLPQVQHWLAWWQHEGQHIHTDINGNTLIQHGFKPSSAFKKALEEAHKSAWRKESTEQQLQAALSVLHTSFK